MNSFSPCCVYCRVCSQSLLVFQMDERERKNYCHFLCIFYLIRVLAALYIFFHSHSVQFFNLTRLNLVCESIVHGKLRPKQSNDIANYINLYFKMRAHFTIFINKKIYLSLTEKKKLTISKHRKTILPIVISGNSSNNKN